MTQSSELPQIQLTKAIRSWSVEDRHNIRIYFRRLRIQLVLARTVAEGSREKTRLKKLYGFSGAMLDACGAVRDIDVLFETYACVEGNDTKLLARWKKQRARMIEKLAKDWPLGKRKSLLGEISWFLEFRDGAGILRPQNVKEASGALRATIATFKPRNKESWHELRRKLRRLNFLNSLLGRKKRKLILLQKSLGLLQDLESLAKECNPNARHLVLEKKTKKTVRQLYRSAIFQS